MPSGWSFRHFVFFHEKAHFLIGLCHRQPNNKAISEVFLYDERPSESDKAVFSHQLSWTFFWRELWLTQWRNSQYRGRTITNLYFADDIYGLAWKEERLASLVDRLERRPNWSRIKNGVSVDIRVNGKKLDKMDSFKCVGTVITDQGSKPKVLSRIAQMTAALSKLKTIWVIWNDKNISLSSKIRLMETHGLPDCLGILVDLRNLVIDREHPEETAGHGDEMLWKLLASHTKTTSLTMQSHTKSGKPLGPIIIP